MATRAAQTSALRPAAGLALRTLANLEIRPGELQLFELFLVLAERVDIVVQRPEIYEQVWGGAMTRRDRSVDVLVRKVRAKLRDVAPDWRYIHTHFGIGYRLSPQRIDEP